LGNKEKWIRSRIQREEKKTKSISDRKSKRNPNLSRFVGYDTERHFDANRKNRTIRSRIEVETTLTLVERGGVDLPGSRRRYHRRPEALFRQRSYRHRAERSRAAALHARACSGSDHRPKAVRQRRAHPRASVRAGEGPLGGAAAPLQAQTVPWLLAVVARERKGEEKKEDSSPGHGAVAGRAARRLDAGGAPAAPWYRAELRPVAGHRSCEQNALGFEGGGAGRGFCFPDTRARPSIALDG